MASDDLEEHKKPFGHCKVKWRIDHFSFQTLQGDKWKIKSPEFTINGSEETIWFMSLRSHNDRVYFNIVRSTTDLGPKHICLNLIVHSGTSEENSVFCKKMLISLRKGGKYEVFLGNSDSLQTETDQLNDALTITCKMIVYNKNASKKVRECNDAGLKLLSENMLHLYKSSQNFDVKLLFGDNVILAHKAILSARNWFLSSLVVNNDDDDMEVDDIEECSIINFTGELDYIGMEQVLAYLYTGDIMHVLVKPSFSIYECATYLAIDEIKILYKPDELFLTTSVDVEVHRFFLRGYKFEKRSLIWRIHHEGPKNTFQLLFYPNGERNGNYISLFTKTFEKTMYSTVEFNFIDKNGRSFAELHLTVTDTCIDETISRSMEKLNSTDQLFEIAIKVKLSARTKILNIKEERSVFTSYLSEDFYEMLSADIECLLDDGPFRDLLIDNNGVYFWAHKCILASRSQFFSDMLDAKEEGEVIKVPNFEPHIVSAILTYVYSGILQEVTDDNIINVYEAAEYGKLSHLKSKCTDLLKQSFKTNKNIRCRVVKLAEVHEDILLKKHALSYLFDGSQILIPNPLPSSEDVHTCRHCR